MTTTKSLIPYVVFDVMPSGSTMEYSSAPEDELHSHLLKQIERLMEIHDFDYEDEEDEEDEIEDDDDEVDEECYECECRVVSKKYITIVDGKKYCGGCNPTPKIIVTKEIYSRFMQFLKNNNENCDIIYFKHGKWVDFIVE
jgi:hypothetical protein